MYPLTLSLAGRRDVAGYPHANIRWPHPLNISHAPELKLTKEEHPQAAGSGNISALSGDVVGSQG